MKKAILLACSVLLVCSLTGCGKRQAEEPPPPASSQMIPVPDELPALPPEPPLLDWMGEAACPDFLDAEQQDLYLRACTAFQFLTLTPDAVEEFPLADGSRLELSGGEDPHRRILRDGLEYTVSMGRYCRWDDFQTMLDGLFTPGYQQELLQPEGFPAPLFISDESGAMCYLSGGRGANRFYELANIPDRFEPVTQTDEVIEFSLIAHYADLVTDSQGREELGPVYTETYPIRMVLTDEGWRFEEFHLPY